jgi:hypothetical protein
MTFAAKTCAGSVDASTTQSADTAAGWTDRRLLSSWRPSRDNKEVDAFIKDPFCCPSLKPDSMQSFLDAFPRLADPRQIRKVREDLPIYIFSGSDDPVRQRMEGMRVLIDRYRAADLPQSLTISIQAAGTKCCTRPIAATFLLICLSEFPAPCTMGPLPAITPVPHKPIRGFGNV